MQCMVCGHRWCWVCGKELGSVWHALPLACKVVNGLNQKRQQRPCTIFVIELLIAVLFPLLAVIGLVIGVIAVICLI